MAPIVINNKHATENADMTLAIATTAIIAAYAATCTAITVYMAAA